MKEDVIILLRIIIVPSDHHWLDRLFFDSAEGSQIIYFIKCQVAIMGSNPPFYLQPNENVVSEASVMQYYGVGLINVGFAGGGITDSGLGGGLFTSKQHKREKSIFDATNCHVYLTNKRLVFVKASINLGATEEKGLDGVFSDIFLTSIEGIASGIKFKVHSTIDLSVRSPNGGIDKISFAFLDTAGRTKMQMFARNRRVQERDDFLKLIQKFKQKVTEELELKSTNMSELSNKDPLKILKIRYAKGEISKEEFEEISKLL